MSQLTVHKCTGKPQLRVCGAITLGMSGHAWCNDGKRQRRGGELREIDTAEEFGEPWEDLLGGQKD